MPSATRIINGDSKPSTLGSTSLETAVLINSANPTIVAAWDLAKPSQAETSKAVRFGRRVETLGPAGDRRKKADDSALSPPGQYKAICKLFMAYAGDLSLEYIGTGFLIDDDVVATAGHCVYDWKTKGAHLKHVRCYFGYASDESPGVYRYGIAAACPAEYLKAPSDVHDVAFIRLDSKPENVPRLQYSDTPASVSAELGVAGYPGDRDFGAFMYEHWANVKIDLARTDNLLSYEIDTMPGQSGAPVLRKLPNGKVEAIGVHIAGGFPNVGSVIGRIGNRFEEYRLAIDVKNGGSSPLASVMEPSGTAIKGFQMISISPLVSKSRTENAPVTVHESASTSASKMESALNELFGVEVGRSSGTPVLGKPAKKVASGTLTQLPEVLRIKPHLETDPAPPKIDFDKAVANAKAQDDVQTIFFVDFPAKLEGDALKAQQKLQSSVQSWQAWASTNCEGKVQQQVDAGKLPSDNKGGFARGAYRAKVFDYLFRKSSWFAKTFDQSMLKHIEVKKVHFHTEILTTILEGYAVPSSVLPNLEKVLKTISDGISASSEKDNTSQQYWIMLTKYNWLSVSETVQTVVRVIQFQVDQSARKYSTNKASYDAVSFDLSFNQFQADFNNDIYSKIRDTMDEKLVSQGLDLVKANFLEVEIPI